MLWKIDDIRVLGTLYENRETGLPVAKLVRELYEIKTKNGKEDEEDRTRLISKTMSRLKKLMDMGLVTRDENKVYRTTNKVVAGPGKCDIFTGDGFDITSIGIAMKIEAAQGKMILGTSEDVTIELLKLD